jgi:co-chaperonin GroES (HSP10)
MNVKPLANRVIISPTDQETEEVRASGLITMKKELPPSTRGKVMAIGEKVSADIKVGDLVQYGQHSGIIFAWEEKEYLIMREPDIICVL